MYVPRPLHLHILHVVTYSVVVVSEQSVSVLVDTILRSEKMSSNSKSSP